MRIIITVDFPDYHATEVFSQGNASHPWLTKMIDEIQHTVWQAVSGQVTEVDIQFPRIGR